MVSCFLYIPPTNITWPMNMFTASFWNSLLQPDVSMPPVHKTATKSITGLKLHNETTKSPGGGDDPKLFHQ